tara:strand:- start:66 stop:254 length:189 start_codon:yes stop_codon:yes gene_type:complete
VVGTLEDPRAQKKPLDIVSTVKIDGKVNHLLDLEGCSGHIVAFSGNAVGAIKNAMVGQQNFQ